MIRLALCDDESQWLEKSKALLLKYAELHPEYNLQISCFSSGVDVVKSVMMNGSFDIYVLDVVMPRMTGIDTGIRLREYDQMGKIIYLTSSPDFGIDSYIAGAFYYLLKPAEEAQLFNVLDRAAAEINRRKERAIKVKTADDVSLVHFDDILYVELVRKSLCFHLADGSEICSLSQRDAFSQCVSPLLTDKRFSLAGTSMCLNLFFVKSVSKDSVLLKNGTSLYLSKKACLSLRADWLDYWFEEGDSSNA